MPSSTQHFNTGVTDDKITGYIAAIKQHNKRLQSMENNQLPLNHKKYSFTISFTQKYFGLE